MAGCFGGGQRRQAPLSKTGPCRKHQAEGLLCCRNKLMTLLVFDLFKYLKDPSQPILEALDKDTLPTDDAWDSVSIVSFPEKEQEDVPQSTWTQDSGPVCQPVGQEL